MGKWVYILIFSLILVAIIASILIVFGILSRPSAEEIACIDSGGTVTTLSCCARAGNFPNTCTLGLCGCSSDASKEFKSCSCGTGMCFNGTTCVLQG